MLPHPLDNSCVDRFRLPLGERQVPKVDTKLAQLPDVAEKLKLASLEANFGVSYKEVYMQEAELVSHARRLPGTGLRSSMLPLARVLDREDTIDLGEYRYLEDPNETSAMRLGFVPEHDD